MTFWRPTHGSYPYPASYRDHATTTEHNGGRGASSRYRGRCALCAWTGEPRKLLTRAKADAKDHSDGGRAPERPPGIMGA